MGGILWASKQEETEPVNYPIDPSLKEKAYALENEYISKYCSPLTLKELHYKDIPIHYHGETYLHTLIRNEEDLSSPNYNNKKILIMLHGYQASSFIFYRIIPLISNEFIVICPDLIGIGFSSRPKIEFTSNEQTIDFFVECIEKLRQSLNINKFYICGHSLGGYFAMNYVLKYPQYVENKIVLMSPTGIGDPTKGGDCTQNLTFGQRVVFCWTLGLLFYLQPTLQNLSKKYIIGNSEDITIKNINEIIENNNNNFNKDSYFFLEEKLNKNEIINYVDINDISFKSKLSCESNEIDNEICSLNHQKYDKDDDNLGKINIFPDFE
jgi:hypothetical protein